MSLKTTPPLLLALSAVLAACGPGQGTPPGPATGPGFKLSSTAASARTGWFIELAGDPTGLTAQNLGAQQTSFRAQASASGVQYRETASYRTLFNGFAVQASPAELGRLSRLPGVIGVYPVQQISPPRTSKAGLNAQALSPDVQSALAMTGADLAQSQLGLSGKGVRVGIIDTGLDLGHPAFQGRVVAGYDFVGDDYDASQPGSKPVPDASPDDCQGNGTNVAGILGGNDPAGGFVGVAPGVSLGIYKVFGCQGTTDSATLLTAMERAKADGMGMLNISLGVPFQWPQYPTARAASRLVKRGVVVSAAAGDSGKGGPYSVGAPALGENVLAVASVENTRVQLGNFTLTTGGAVIGYRPVSGSPTAPVGLNLPVGKLPSSTPITDNDGCSIDGLNPYKAGSLNGQAALVRLGNCAAREKIINAQNAGAQAIVFYNNQPGFASMTAAPATPDDSRSIDIPVVSVLAADGTRIDAAIAGGARLTFNADPQTFDNPSGNTLSAFSAFGVSPDLELKPDLAAPGGWVRTTTPLKSGSGGYAVLSGTGLAAPQVSGIAALLLQGRPGIQSKDMAALLMNNSALLTTLDGPPAPVQQQGAGLVNVLAASSNPVTATPAKLSLGASQTFGPRSKVIVLRNSGTQTETFTATNVAAQSLDRLGNVMPPQPTGMTINGQTVDGGGVRITVPAGGETELNVLITPPSRPVLGQYGGAIALSSASGRRMVIPYSGFVGNYQALTVLGDVSFDGGRTFKNFPALYDPRTFEFYPEGLNLADPPAYTLKDVQVFDDNGQKITVLDAPQVLVHFGHQARRLTLEVLDGGGASLGSVFTQEYIGRSATNIYTDPNSDAFSFVGWDGTLAGGQMAPAGTYQLRLRVLKALGNPAAPTDTETYLSQKFTVVRE
ncbi:S8 family serine peptidase [Deinococcus marmoris]|uniref:Serine protease, subtilase family n=1 Tax=Deinococcus marmoris TaxID=249408 RepID=A0A1U7P510_9DEIO|nr:S8 family serine peptidase [Deinococcus marmoris]OLV20249.1 serine protease, subtilase family [Deinococcus marmoris]